MGSIEQNGLKADWKGIVARKRRDQAQAIEAFLQKQHGAKSHRENIGICSLSHSDLLEALTKGDLTAESVALAYINR